MNKESLNEYIESLGMTLGESLLTPTKIYVKAMKSIKDAGVVVKGCSHITGGGFYENIPRMLPEGALAKIKKDSYPVLPIFNMMAREGKVEDIGGRGKKHEFDFIVEFRDRIFIFETKTGALGVERWIDHARMFNDAKGPNRFLMCCSDDSLNAKLFQPYRLFHLNTLTDEFGEYVKHEFKM